MYRTNRATIAQKAKLLDFMKSHIQLATGRFSCPDGARQRRKLLEELATCLNAMGNGTQKTEDRWYKAWQDWKSDVKAKARKVKSYHEGTGGGPAPVPLNPIEQEVLDFMGPVAVEGLVVPDTLETQREHASTVVRNRSRSPGLRASASPDCDLSWNVESSYSRRDEEPIQNRQPRYFENPMPENDHRSLHTEESGTRESAKRDPMLDALSRQADASEKQAAAQEKQAAAQEKQAEAICQQSKAIENLVKEMSSFSAAILALSRSLGETRYVIAAEEEQD